MTPARTAARGAARHGRRALALVLAPCLSGCILTGDAVKEPVVDIPPNYRAGGGKSAAALPAPDWWRGFRSRELTALVERAQIANFDIAAAVARIEQADAQTRISGAPLLPLDQCGCVGKPLRHRRRREQQVFRRPECQLRDRLLGQEPRGAARGGIRLDREPLRPRGDRHLHRRERHQHLFPGARRAGPAAHRARQCRGGDAHP